MKTTVLTLITALAMVAFLSSCKNNSAQKKEEPMAASTASTTHGTSTMKKSSTTKKKLERFGRGLAGREEEVDCEEGGSIAFAQ